MTTKNQETPGEGLTSKQTNKQTNKPGHMPVIMHEEKLRQENLKLKASLPRLYNGQMTKANKLGHQFTGRDK